MKKSESAQHSKTGAIGEKEREETGTKPPALVFGFFIHLSFIQKLKYLRFIVLSLERYTVRIIDIGWCKLPYYMKFWRHVNLAILKTQDLATP